MCNTLHVPKTLEVVEYTCYILLLCFIVPIEKYSDHLEFENYLNQFNKTYNNVGIYQKRYEAFKKSRDAIDQLNQNRTNSSALYGFTKYSDIPIHDFLNKHLLPTLSNYKNKFGNKQPSLKETYIKNFKIPMKVDWRERNVVTKVRTQGNCGACWAIAGIEIIESMNAIKSSKLDTFSVQEMIDCAQNNNGCNGGDLFLLFEWLKTENVTIVTEEEYPTKLIDGTCKKTSSSGILIKNYQCDNFIKSEELIVHVLAHYGPVAVAINALPWQNYVSGVIQFHCDNGHLNLNHAVQIVGYDLAAEIPYYIIKNSWGGDFGDKGYLYIAIGGNVCGLAEEVCIVEL